MNRCFMLVWLGAEVIIVDEPGEVLEDLGICVFLRRPQRSKEREEGKIMYTKAELQRIAEKVRGELDRSSPIRLYSDGVPGMTLEEAYQVQFMVAQMRLEKGERQIGFKIGLTEERLQKQFNMKEPVFGHLMSSLVGLDENRIDTDRYVRPIVEPEVTFLLGEDLKGPGITRGHVLAATEGVFASLEIPNMCYAQKDFSPTDIILVDVMAQGLVRGQTMYDVKDIDLSTVSVVLELNGRVSTTGTGASVLGHPADSVVWLANRLVGFDTYLKAGYLVPAGSLTGPCFVEKGDVVKARFSDIGSVDAYFV